MDDDDRSILEALADYELGEQLGRGSCGVVRSGRHRRLDRDVAIKALPAIFAVDPEVRSRFVAEAKMVGGAETLATRAGAISGTPAYMAPEQADGGDLGPPADVFAAAVMLYELLSGQLPYRSDGGSLAFAYRHTSERPTPLGQVAPDVAPELSAVTMQALARWPADRYPTAEAFGVAIGEAASRAWGRGWLQQANLEVIDSGPIMASTRYRLDPPSADSPREARRRVCMTTSADAPYRAAPASPHQSGGQAACDQPLAAPEISTLVRPRMERRREDRHGRHRNRPSPVATAPAAD